MTNKPVVIPLCKTIKGAEDENNKMEKYLATPVFDKDLITVEEFGAIKDKFIFINRQEKGYSFVAPYIILTDGREILTYNNKDKEMEIGIPRLIPKDDHSESDLDIDVVIDMAVIQGLQIYFKRIETREHLNKNNKPNEAPGRLMPLSKDHVNIHSTDKVIVSLDKKYVVPIYFIVFPCNRLLRFMPKDSSPKFTPLHTANILKTNSTKDSLSSVAHTTIVLLNSGQISLPIVSNDDTSDFTNA